jgi:hypothetical protein
MGYGLWNLATGNAQFVPLEAESSKLKATGNGERIQAMGDGRWAMKRSTGNAQWHFVPLEADC